jgi:hypothetical protein
MTCSILRIQSSNIFSLNSVKYIYYRRRVYYIKHDVNMYAVHSYNRMKFSGNSLLTTKMKDFVLKVTGTGVFLWGATSKRDSM